jgi:replicative DNA helicase
MINRTWTTRWPWADFEQVTTPLTGGWIYAIAARPGNGKTSLLMSASRYFADHGKKVLYLDTEMSTPAILASIVAPDSGVSAAEIIQGKATQRQENEVQGLIAEVQRGDRIRVAGVTTWSRLKEEALEVARGWQPDIVILDYIQAIAGERQEIDRVVEYLRQITQLPWHPAVIVGSQLNRIGSDRIDDYLPPYLARLKGSGSIEERADVAIGLSRATRDGVDEDLIKDVMKGNVEAAAIALPNTMHVNNMKHRWYGELRGRTCRLRIQDHQVYGYLPDSPRNVDPGANFQPDEDDTIA